MMLDFTSLILGVALVLGLLGLKTCAWFRLRSPRCWYGFSHGEKLFERDAHGVLVLACSRCPQTWPVLAGEMKTDGPKQQPSTVLGQPKTTVTTARPDNVVEMPRQSQR